jgi:hypothetical protein
LLGTRAERPRRHRAAEERDELAAFRLIELHLIPASGAGLHDIGLAANSQRVSERVSLIEMHQCQEPGVLGRISNQRRPASRPPRHRWALPRRCSESCGLREFHNHLRWYSSRHRAAGGGIRKTRPQQHS